jgi:CheY-like chemotaxis protein
VITVLVVDDDPNVRFTVRVALEGAPPPEGEPMHVVEAASGPAALAVLEEQDVDVVLLDVMMPGMDGFGVLRALRADDAAVDVPVVMLTARGRESDVATAFRGGADDYVTKPFDVDDLARVTLEAAARPAAERGAHRTRELERAELLLQLEHGFGDAGDQADRS